MKPGDKVILVSLPPDLLEGLPQEDQDAIQAVVGQPVELDDIEAVLHFIDSTGDHHMIWVGLDHIKPVEEIEPAG